MNKLVIIFSLFLTVFTSTLWASSNKVSKLFTEQEICGKKSCSDVRHMLKRNAYRGNTFAQKLVALMYLDGLGGNVTPNKAKKFLKMAVAQKDPMAALMIAHLYKGPISDNPEKFEHWLERAAKLSGVNSTELRKLSNVLNANYSKEFDLTQIALKLKQARGSNAYSGGSHILGTSCNNSSKSSCRSHDVRDSAF